MSESDSESNSSSTSNTTSASSHQQQSSADDGHDEKNVVEKKKFKTKQKPEKDAKKSKEKSLAAAEKVKAKQAKKEDNNEDRIEKNGGKSDKNNDEKSLKNKKHSSSESSTSLSSSSSDSSSTSDSCTSSDGEISSSDTSSSDSEVERKKEFKVDVGSKSQKDIGDENLKDYKAKTPTKVTHENDKKCRVETQEISQQTNDKEKESAENSDHAKQSEDKSDQGKETTDKPDADEKPKRDFEDTGKELKRAQVQEDGELPDVETDVNLEKKNSPSPKDQNSSGSKVLQSMVIKPHKNKFSKSRSRSSSKSKENKKERSKTPQKSRNRRSPRSSSHDLQRRSRSRSDTRSCSRSLSKERQRSERSYERRRSPSADYEKRKSRRSKSLDRRREERRKRHAERDEQEKAKRSRRDEENAERREKELNKPDGDPDKDKELDNATVTDPKAKISERQRKTVDLLTSRTGGAYIPPAKLRLMQAEITDKASAAYQRIAWEALKKSIHGYINKVNVDNIAIITRELLKENIVRGRGLLCRSIIQAQAASPTFTHVYAALVSIINSKFPNIGELLLKRLVIQFKRAFRRNDKAVCLSSSRFIAHLVNQRVAHEILALEILTLLVESPTDDSVEVAIAFLKECGMKLTEVTSKGIGAIFEMLKNILHEGKLDKRVQYMIEVVFQVRKDGFKDHQSVIESLELVEEDDQFTHLLMLDDATNTEDMLNAFKFDEEYAANEEKYQGLSKEILGSDASDSDGSGSFNGSDSDSSDSDDDEKGEGKPTAEEIIDNTETNLIALRRTIYLTINSSLDYEECAHKLMKMQLKPGQEIELCHMFLDCCAEQRTYEKFYGLLAQRFCSINKIYIEPFEEIFKDTYQTTHRLDTNRLRNVSKFFAHLLFTDAISWDVLECIKLNEEDTTSSSRIFIKILFQELAEYMGLSQLNKKLKDEVLLESLAGLFPKDNPRNTRFSINFFTSIGLGGLTDELRQFLKNAPKSVPAINAEILANKPIIAESSSSTSSSSSSSTSSSSSSETSSESSSDSDSGSSSEVDKKQRKGKSVKKSKKSKASEKKQKHKRKEKKNKSKKSNKKRKKSDSESSESSSSKNSNDSETSSSEDGKRKSKKRKNGKSKHKTKLHKKSKKQTENTDNSSDDDSSENEENNQRKKSKENGFEVKKDTRDVENNEDKRAKNERPKRSEPQRRDSEVERRREEREKRHREKEQTRERERKRSRSRSQTRERRDERITREDRDRRNRDYERDRDSDRRRARKRYEEGKSRSRSRESSNYVKREREYDCSKVRNTSKERG